MLLLARRGHGLGGRFCSIPESNCYMVLVYRHIGGRTESTRDFGNKEQVTGGQGRVGMENEIEMAIEVQFQKPGIGEQRR